MCFDKRPKAAKDSENMFDFNPNLPHLRIPSELLHCSVVARKGAHHDRADTVCWVSEDLEVAVLWWINQAAIQVEVRTASSP